MRKLTRYKITVTLDVVPEHRTERFPRDLGPWVAFVNYGSDTYRRRQAGRER